MTLREPRPESERRPTAERSRALSSPETAVAIFRTAFVIGVVAALWTRGPVYDFAYPAYIVSVLAGIYNVALLIMLWLRRSIPGQRHFILSLDVVFLTLWVGFGGSVGRAFFPLYYPLMVIAAFWFGMSGAALAAFASSALSIFMLLVVAPHVPGTRGISMETVLVRVPFLFLVALVVGYIANAQKRELEQFEEGRIMLAGFQQHQRLMQEFYELVTPQRLSPPPGLDLGVGFRAAVHWGAGDYYDLLSLEEGRHALYVADVQQKYGREVLQVAVIKYALKVAAAVERRPGRVLERLNELVFDELQPDRFATMFYAQIDHWAGEVTYVNAGHDPALIIRDDGTVQALETGGLVLGVLRDARYDEERVRMGPRDALVLYTDGAVEAANASGEPFGRERLVAAAQAAVVGSTSADDVAKYILGAVTQFAEHGSRVDDVTVMVARIAPRPALAAQAAPDVEPAGAAESAPREVAD